MRNYFSVIDSYIIVYRLYQTCVEPTRPSTAIFSMWRNNRNLSPHIKFLRNSIGATTLDLCWSGRYFHRQDLGKGPKPTQCSDRLTSSLELVFSTASLVPRRWIEYVLSGPQLSVRLLKWPWFVSLCRERCRVQWALCYDKENLGRRIIARKTT